jgi:hypothetical protein
VSSAGDNPFRQFVAAWEAATAVAAEWAEKTAEVTAESFRKLASDPAIRAVIESWRIAPVWSRRTATAGAPRPIPTTSAYVITTR